MVDMKALREAAELATPKTLPDGSVFHSVETQLAEQLMSGIAGPQTILALLDVVEAAKELRRDDESWDDLNAAVAALEGGE